jgi:hypothetical protein
LLVLFQCHLFCCSGDVSGRGHCLLFSLLFIDSGVSSVLVVVSDVASFLVARVSLEQDNQPLAQMLQP